MHNLRLTERKILLLEKNTGWPFCVSEDGLGKYYSDAVLFLREICSNTTISLNKWCMFNLIIMGHLRFKCEGFMDSDNIAS